MEEQVTLRGFIAGEFTRQQVFDYCATKLLEQGKPSGRVDGNGMFQCEYNGPGGKHCAIGWLVTDEERVEEQSAIRSIATNLQLTQRLSPSDEEFLTRLQAAHDDAASDTDELFATGVRSRLRTAAFNFNLDPSVTV
jgi:hypothetical protein